MDKLGSLVKARDGLLQIVDALNELLESMKPFPEPCDLAPSMEGIVWKATVGPSGPYERADADETNPDYKRLIHSLQEHHGKMTVDGYFLWSFVDQSIGRKKTERS